MRTLVLGAFLLAGPPAASSAPAEYKDLTPGRYVVKVGGMLCAVCARGLAEAVSALDEVAEAKVDFDDEQLALTVKKDKTLKIAALRKAFHKASKRINLGVELDIEGIRYVP